MERQMMKPLQGKPCKGFCVFLGCTRKAGTHNKLGKKGFADEF